MYEALAAQIANINLLLISFEINWLRKAMTHPLIKGITKAKTTGNHPKAKNDFNFFPLVIPVSKRNIARIPLKRSFVK